MSDLIRDTLFGHFVRLITRNRYLQYAEEKDPLLWKQYVDREGTMNMALYGRADLPTNIREEKEKELQSDSPSESSGVKHSPESIKAPQEHPAADGHNDVPKEQLAHALTQQTTHEHQIHSALTNQRVDTEKGRDATIISWWGDNDPENPMNWSTTKKVFVTFEICLLTFSVYIGSAIYTAGIQNIVQIFGVSPVAATLGLTLFVAGYGLGPMIWAPLSEIPQIGRNPIYIGTLAVFVILQVPTALSVNFGMLLAFRFITGFIGSPVLATGGASIADMFQPKKRAYGIGIWGIAAVCGPVLGPLVGGFAVQARDWSWTIWELMWLCGFSLVLFIFFLPETSSTNILYRRTRRLRKLTGIETLRCQPELMSEQMTGKEVAMIALVRPIVLNFQEPIVLLLNLYIALVYGLLYIWFESFPLVFEGIYHFDLGQNGLAFLGIFLGAIITIPPFFWWLHKYVEPKFNENGEICPEERIPASFVGSFAIPICLFMFGWSARPDVHWIVPIIGSGFFSVGAFLLFNSVLNYLGDAYPEHAASVLAGNDFMRSSFGAGFPLFATGMYHQLGIGWASSLLGFLSIAFIPIPFFLYKYGRAIRLRSKHARHDL